MRRFYPSRVDRTVSTEDTGAALGLHPLPLSYSVTFVDSVRSGFFIPRTESTKVTEKEGGLTAWESGVIMGRKGFKK